MSANVIRKPHTSRSTIHWIAKVSILGAIAFVLMMFEIPLPIAPSFYKLGLDEVPVLLAGFSLGPGAAVATEALKIVLNLLFQGSDTAMVGELGNFLIGLSFVLPATLYYRNHKTRKGAYIGLLIGTLCLGVCGGILNYVMLIPMYSYFYGLPIDTIIAMGSAINPLITNRFTFCLFAVVPFNLIKGTVVSLIVALIYKRVSKILHG